MRGEIQIKTFKLKSKKSHASSMTCYVARSYFSQAWSAKVEKNLPWGAS